MEECELAASQSLNRMEGCVEKLVKGEQLSACSERHAGKMLEQTSREGCSKRQSALDWLAREWNQGLGKPQRGL